MLALKFQRKLQNLLNTSLLTALSLWSRRHVVIGSLFLRICRYRYSIGPRFLHLILALICHVLVLEARSILAHLENSSATLVLTCLSHLLVSLCNVVDVHIIRGGGRLAGNFDRGILLTVL